MSSLGEDTAPVSALTPGTLLDGKLEIRGVLGEGGMGLVYDAWQHSVGRRVAVKILHRQQLRDPRARERFRFEAQILAQLQHPNIVTLHDFGTENDLGYLVFEYLSGRPLAAERGKPLDAIRAARITIQICRALAAAHTAGIVHRDLKPANVFLINLDHEPDFTKLLDFGIAKSLPRERDGATRLTGLHQRMGTLRYMAPEQIRDTAVDHRADLYALGCLFFELLSGAPPFTGRAASKLVEQHLTHPPPAFRSVQPDCPLDAELESVAMTLLQKNPKDRFQSAAAVEAALADWMSRARVESPAPAPRPIDRRRRVEAGGTATDPRSESIDPTPSSGTRDGFTDPSMSLAGDSGSGIVADPSAADRAEPGPGVTRAEHPRSESARSPARPAKPAALSAAGRAESGPGSTRADHFRLESARRLSRAARLAALLAAVAVAAVVAALVPTKASDPPIVVPPILLRHAEPVLTDTGTQAAVSGGLASSEGSTARRPEPAPEAQPDDPRAGGRRLDPLVRIRNVRVEHGALDAAEISSILQARAKDLTRCFARAQPARTLRVRFVSSEGSTTISALPADAASQRFSDCTAALDPPIPLPVSRTRAIYFFSTDVVPGATP